MGQSVQGLVTMLDGMIEDYDEEAVGEIEFDRT